MCNNTMKSMENSLLDLKVHNFKKLLIVSKVSLLIYIVHEISQKQPLETNYLLA